MPVNFEDFMRKQMASGEGGPMPDAAPTPMPMPEGTPVPFEDESIPGQRGRIDPRSVYMNKEGIAPMPSGTPMAGGRQSSIPPELLLLLIALAGGASQRDTMANFGRDAGDLYDVNYSNGDPGIMGLFGSNKPDLRNPPPGIDMRRRGLP